MNVIITELIARRRRQLFVHSTIYYRFCTAIISDATFDRWAYELARLQRDYPEESASAPFHTEFAGWDGTTGYDLPWNAWADRKAAELTELYRRRTKIERTTNRAHSAVGRVYAGSER